MTSLRFIILISFLLSSGCDPVFAQISLDEVVLYYTGKKPSVSVKKTPRYKLGRYTIKPFFDTSGFPPTPEYSPKERVLDKSLPLTDEPAMLELNGKVVETSDFKYR